MKINQIEKYFDSLYPETNTFDWDNSGLLICADREREVNTVLTCLDVTDSVIDKAIDLGAELIISHHPIIFSPIKSITEDSLIGRKIISLLENNIAVLSLHTRFDFAENGLNDTICKMLDIELLRDVHPDGEDNVRIIGNLERDYFPEELALKISNSLDTEVKLYSADMKIKKVCICSGGGKSYLDFAIKNAVDAFITGDLNHHNVVDAIENGITLIDFGHYNSERLAGDIFKKVLLEKCDDLRIISYSEDFSGKTVNNYC